MTTAAVRLDPARRTARPGGLARWGLSALIVGTLAPLAGLQLAAATDPAPTHAGSGHAFDRSPTISSRSTGRLSFANAAPGATATEDITVRVAKAAAEVGMYAEIAGTGLDRWIDVRVLQGTMHGGSFHVDDVVYDGRLSRFPATAAAALDAGPGTWRPGEAHTFRVVATLADANEAQGLHASVDLVWVASTPQ